jgi:hypothetical protein
MPAQHMTGRRLAALAVAILLIGGGATGLGLHHGAPAVTITSGIAMLIGLRFLQIAARSGRKRSG